MTSDAFQVPNTKTGAYNRPRAAYIQGQGQNNAKANGGKVGCHGDASLLSLGRHWSRPPPSSTRRWSVYTRHTEYDVIIHPSLKDPRVVYVDIDSKFFLKITDHLLNNMVL